MEIKILVWRHGDGVCPGCIGGCAVNYRVVRWIPRLDGYPGKRNIRTGIGRINNRTADRDGCAGYDDIRYITTRNRPAAVCDHTVCLKRLGLYRHTVACAVCNGRGKGEYAVRCYRQVVSSVVPEHHGFSRCKSGYITAYRVGRTAAAPSPAAGEYDREREQEHACKKHQPSLFHIASL
ncbi:hypothetical protein BMS3Bbin05_00532 [bacterium BMS3Bbin05]|nr:hypothetical protein BMS3Bbin05_00532 [bacterium BMS3Bbin05]